MSAHQITILSIMVKSRERGINMTKMLIGIIKEILILMITTNGYFRRMLLCAENAKLKLIFFNKTDFSYFLILDVLKLYLNQIFIKKIHENTS